MRVVQASNRLNMMDIVLSTANSSTTPSGLSVRKRKWQGR